MRCSALVLALAVASVACRDREGPTPSPTPSPAPASGASDAAGAGPPPFTIDDAVRLFEATAACTLEPHGLDHTCPARNALDAAYGHDIDPQMTRYETVKAAARRVLTHASPSVRARAYDELDGDKDEALLVRALGAETDVMALRAMIFTAHTGNDAVLDAVLRHITHAAPDVRLAVMRQVAAEYYVAHPGLFEAIVDRVANDADPAVRIDACRRLGLLQDPRSVAVHDRLLVAATPAPLFDACAAGLVYTWLADAEKEHPVEAAYRRTLALLRKGPHRAGAPGPATIDAIEGLERGDRTFDDLPPWVDVADARDAVAAFAASPRADPDARLAAARLVIELRPSVAELRRYRARVRDRGDVPDEIREDLTDAESWVDDPP